MTIKRLAALISLAIGALTCFDGARCDELPQEIVLADPIIHAEQAAFEHSAVERSLSDYVGNAHLESSHSCDSVLGHEWLSGDCLKGIPVGKAGSYDIGGSYRARHHRETNMRPGTTGGLSGVDDTFWLHQVRLWMEGNWTDNLGFRIGFMDASSAGEEFPSRAREVNQHDLYQAYVNAVLHRGAGELTARIGRQEIRYGSARLMMAPAWANRRRTHDGVRFIWDNKAWEVNPFWVRPALRNRASFRTFDIPNPNQQLYGIFATYKEHDKNKADVYWLAFDIERPAGGERYDTFGTRLFGEWGEWLYEFEGGLQLGTNLDDTNHVAGFYTGGVGRKLKSCAWKTELWVYFDWASGDDTVGNGFHTYVQRAHYYLGFMDIFGRRNLEDLNIRLSTKPTDKLELLLWCHFFSLANGNDVPYNINMRPYANLPAGSAGSQTLGTELDFLATYNCNEQTQLRFGYSYFWSGSFYDLTPGVPYSMDANFLYAHYRFKF